MSLTASQINNLRKKYNVGSVQDSKPSGEQIANDRINRLKANTYGGENINQSPTQSIQEQSNIGIGGEKEGFIKKIAKFFSPKSVEGFGDTIGTALATPMINKVVEEETEQNLELQDKIMEKLKDPNVSKEQKDKLIRLSKELNFDMTEAIPTLNKTAKEIAAEGLGTLGTIAVGATPASGLTSATAGSLAAKVGAQKATTNIIGRLGFATAFGAGSGTKKGLEQDKEAFDIAKDAFKGGVVGLGTGLFFEGVMRGIKKVAPLFGKNTYNKELQPNANELASNIKRNADTFGEKVRNITDENGKAIYKGTYNTLMKQGKNEVSKNGDKLTALLKAADKVDDFSINKNKIAGNIISDLKNQYGSLTSNQLKSIKLFVRKMPNQMNRTDMQKYKRLYDSLMSKTDWSKIIVGDTQASFAGQVKYILRDNIKKAIEQSTDDVVIKTLNTRMGIGMEVRDLAAKQLASRAKMKVQASGMNPISRLLSRIWDDGLFNAGITTRASQLTQKIGEGTPGLVSQATKFGTISKLNK